MQFTWQTSGRSTAFHEISNVRFQRLSNATIESYLAKVAPLDKAGAYAAQEKRRGNHRKNRRLIHERRWSANGKDGRCAGEIRHSSEVGLTNRVNRQTLDHVFAIIGPESDGFCLQIVPRSNETHGLAFGAHEDRVVTAA